MRSFDILENGDTVNDKSISLKKKTNYKPEIKLARQAETLVALKIAGDVHTLVVVESTKKFKQNPFCNTNMVYFKLKLNLQVSEKSGPLSTPGFHSLPKSTPPQNVKTIFLQEYNILI